MPLDQSYDEKNLLHRVAGGDESAFRAFYNLHWNRIYTLAMLYLKDPLAAQDAVQDVFEKLWTQRAAITHIESPGAYLYVMGRNYIISELRKKRILIDPDPTVAEGIQEQYLLPDKLLDAKEVSILLGQAIEALPPRQKRVFQLSREEQLPLKEVAAKLGISYSTAREHMSHALKSIRKHLAEHLQELPVIIVLFFLQDL